ncbi:ATP-binding cassette transporter [Clonorchis sinensis]|uniref:ATP-binding cassette transporter n=1 Tax=Clonorchis sinensis TaxID=79923 RepID=G7YER9_CLOSI|nr:ATP-binding cassette transporter [Clonorchis sinensis]
MSDRTEALLKSRRNVPAGPEHHLAQRVIRCQVKVIVRADREVWWEANEMEETQKDGNARRLFQLIRVIGPWRLLVSGATKDQSGAIILNKERYDRWAEYSEQFSWPPVATRLEPKAEV